MSTTKRSRRAPAGMTLIELLVVAGVIGILVALLIPAVQSARESARRTSCGSNLRQIGLALASYESQWQRFPSLVVFGPAPAPLQKYSVFVRILPGLGETPLFNSVNMSAPLGAMHYLPATHANYTAYATRLAVYVCPSDAGPGPPAPSNYRVNVGRGPYWGRDGTLMGNDTQGPFFSAFCRGAADFTDGLSDTVLVGERCVGGGVDSYTDKFRDVLPAEPSAANSLAVGQPYSVVCRASEGWAFAQVHPYPWSGWTWVPYSLSLTGYNHAMTPNYPVTDCGDANDAMLLGTVTARSFHSGGVQVLTGDGAVRFVRDGINPQAWQALSTCAAGDAPGAF